jgi:hypothetical protein
MFSFWSPHQTNQQPSHAAGISACYARTAWECAVPTSSVAIQTNNLRRLLHTVEALSELGPALTAEREFSDTSHLMLSAIMEAAGSREGALLLFSDKPAILTSAAAQGFALMPDPAFIPLLPKHVHALTAARGPIVLNSSTYSVFLSSNGNVAPELFKCLAPLKASGRLAGVVALGRRPGDALYEESELDALELLCTYVALAVQNHALTQTVAQRVSENLRLMASLHGFYDNALEAFATAIDVKHVNIHGHSLRVGRYAAAIGEALGLQPSDIAALRSAGYLHDIGKVAVDRRLFGKPGALDPEEFREMADHRDRALASRTQRRLRLSRQARGGRLAHGRANRSAGGLVRRHDQRAPLPRPAYGRQCAERTGSRGSAEIRPQRGSGPADPGAPRCGGKQPQSAPGERYGEHRSD